MFLAIVFGIIVAFIIIKLFPVILLVILGSTGLVLNGLHRTFSSIHDSLEKIKKKDIEKGVRIFVGSVIIIFTILFITTLMLLQ